MKERKRKKDSKETFSSTSCFASDVFGDATTTAGAGIGVVGGPGSGREAWGSGNGGTPGRFSDGAGAGAGRSEEVEAGSSVAGDTGVGLVSRMAGVAVKKAKATAEGDGVEADRANLPGVGDRVAAEWEAGDECQRSKAGRCRLLLPQHGHGSLYPTISISSPAFSFSL